MQLRTDHKTLNRLFAALVFIYALIIYVSTLAPTASFWDPGEFIAVAHGLEITHPPGAPLFLLLGHLFSMFAPASKVALFMNFMSGLASAFTVMLLYMIIVLLIKEFKGNPDEYSTFDKVGMYAGGILGAITFAVTDSFWFNAVESNVFATSLFFLAMVVWLVLKWAENHDSPYNERWLVLISYMFGLAVGVHLLNLLAIFFVVPIIYFKKFDFKITTFIVAALIASATLLLIYPITISEIPKLSGYISNATLGLISTPVFLILFLAILVYAIYYTNKKNLRLLNIAFMCYAMIVIGFSSYALVMIRSQQNPPIDENDPQTVQAFVNYINRTQYGKTPLFYGYDYSNDLGRIDRSHKVLFPRRYDGQQQSYLNKYAQYNSDWDFFWNYQIGHMYLRYFAWQFIGRQSDIQDTGVATGFSSNSRYKNNPAHNVYYFLPFLLGIIGLIFHFQKDWKRALSVLALFIMTGIAIIIYLNQYPFQPRERDYSYVGSFFAYSIWIGIGVTGLVELAKDSLKRNKFVMYGLVGLCFIAVPFNMLRENYNDHDRSKRYVASDYAYNLLNSCAPYSILFTNGDNDTFPLWYLQEVRHVRTDVRVVCLSLLDTKWYIKQLRDEWSHKSPPLPITFTNKQLDKLSQKFNFDKPSDFYTPHQITIPVDKKYLRYRFADPNDTEKYAEEGHIGKVKRTNYVLRSPKLEYSIPIDSLDSVVTWHYKGRYLGQNRSGKKLYYTMIHDDVVLNILKNNKWARPVYFAVTVARNSQLNLQSYFRLQGDAYRVVPHKNPGHSPYVDTKINGERLRSFKFRGLNNPHVYLDENIRRMVDNDRELIANEATTFLSKNDPDSAVKWLKWGESNIPFTHVHGSQGSMIRYAYKYALAGDTADAVRLGEMAYPKLKSELGYAMTDLNKLMAKVSDLQTASKKARMNADIDKSRKLKAQASNLSQNRKNLLRNVYYASSRLFVLQRIYYISNDTTKAKDVATIGDSLTQNLVGFPKTADQNKKLIDRMYIN